MDAVHVVGGVDAFLPSERAAVGKNEESERISLDAERMDFVIRNHQLEFLGGISQENELATER